MKTEKKNSGEYVFTGDLENDKEAEELLEKVKANTFGTVTFYAFRMGKRVWNSNRFQKSC